MVSKVVSGGVLQPGGDPPSEHHGSQTARNVGFGVGVTVAAAAGTAAVTRGAALPAAVSAAQKAFAAGMPAARSALPMAFKGVRTIGNAMAPKARGFGMRVFEKASTTFVSHAQEQGVRALSDGIDKAVAEVQRMVRGDEGEVNTVRTAAADAFGKMAKSAVHIIEEESTKMGEIAKASLADYLHRPQ
jgi:hypothetical protein